MIERLALGAAQFGMRYGIANEVGTVAQAEVQRILEFASSVGICTIDTAMAYGDSEATLGSVGVRDWNVISKLPGLPDPCKDVGDWVVQQVLSSLKRLQKERLYSIMLHRPDQILGDYGPEMLNALEYIKRSGYAERVGVSIYSPDELGRLFDRFHFDIVQAPLSILDRRLSESGWSDRLKSTGVEVHARSVFLQGLLLMPGHVRPPQFSQWSEIWRIWESWLFEEQLSPLEACLCYVLSAENVDKVVVGIDSLRQLEQIASTEVGPLSCLPIWPDVDERLVNPARWNDL